VVAGIVDPMDWERAQRDAKTRALAKKIESSTDPAEQRSIQRKIRQPGIRTDYLDPHRVELQSQELVRGPVLLGDDQVDRLPSEDLQAAQQRGQLE
jgi:hypothetical protein